MADLPDAVALIALGANLEGPAGRPDQALRAALVALEGLGALVAVSRFYRSPAFPAGAGPDFVNACAALRCDLPPEALLAALHRIEADLGRRRDGGRWQARAMDLDLLAMGDAMRPDAAGLRRWMDLPEEARGRMAPDRLILPHPRMQDRGFVLIPLAEIAPGWRHPLLGVCVAQMAAALPAADRAALVPL